MGESRPSRDPGVGKGKLFAGFRTDTQGRAMPADGTASAKTKKQEWASSEFLEGQGGQCDRRQGERGRVAMRHPLRVCRHLELQSDRISLVFKWILKSSVLER